MILSFEKPKKVRSTKEHNERYGADGAVPGVYVPNMSDEDMYRWKAKHIKGENERIEIRKTVGQAQMVVIVHKCTIDGPQVVMSTNGKLYLRLQDWTELTLAVEEAKAILGI